MAHETLNPEDYLSMSDKQLDLVVGQIRSESNLELSRNISEANLADLSDISEVQ